ncbi:MAG: NAD(P)-binding domain-containing protein [Corynebacterium sp.]|nr:NAD(P)-binding domain-containing protein [Corynebacterium sp.]MDN6510298.1 NAD(P)-binding domain-containing protein [Corynebacterium sp.]
MNNSMNSTLGTVGFVGVGSIAVSMVEGLLRSSGAGDDSTPVVLSPRGSANVARLRERFPQASVAASNAEVVDQSDVVVVAVRPDQLDEALAEAPFRDGQTVVSVLAGVSIEAVRRAVGRDDIPVARAIPLPPVAEHGIEVPVTPDIPAAVELFDRIGGALVVPDESQMAVLSATTGACTGLLQYISSLVDWTVGRGLPQDVAEPFIRGMAASLAPSLVDTATPMPEVIRSHETPGGLNEQLRTTFFDDATTGRLHDALDGTWRRAAQG